jgi:hypothetical protein
MTLHADNVISLRTVSFRDDGILGRFVLLPPIPDRRPDGHLRSGVCWVYKRHRPLWDRLKGCYRKHESAFILRHMRSVKVRPDPVVNFLWSDNGHSVAAIVDGEPMGFVAEDKFCAYSKAFDKPEVMNTWDEDLFQKTFKA